MTSPVSPSSSTTCASGLELLFLTLQLLRLLSSRRICGLSSPDLSTSCGREGSELKKGVGRTTAHLLQVDVAVLVHCAGEHFDETIPRTNLDVRARDWLSDVAARVRAPKRARRYPN